MTTPQRAATTSPATARTFVVGGTAASFAAWEFAFNLMAFETIDHRLFSGVWILCTVAFVASMVLHGEYYDIGMIERTALAMPTLWLFGDVVGLDRNDATWVVLLALSVLALPVAIYVLARMLAGDFFALNRRLQAVLAAVVLVVGLAGAYVGASHDRFLLCEDFERIGDFAPTDCVRSAD